MATAKANLSDNLKSHSQIIRQASLALLCSPLMDPDTTSEVLTYCLATEKITLNIEGEKERIQRTSRIGQGMRVNNPPSASVVSLWLLGQLKVNLQSVWAPSSRALKFLVENYEDTVWNNILAEVRKLVDGAECFLVPTWSGLRKDIDDEVKESERTWQDPSGHKLRITIARWVTIQHCRNSVIQVYSFIVKEEYCSFHHL